MVVAAAVGEGFEGGQEMESAPRSEGFPVTSAAAG